MRESVRPLDVVRQLHDRYALSYEDIASSLGTSEDTLQLWLNDSEAEPPQSLTKRLAEFDAFLAELARAFGRVADAKAWFGEQIPALNGKTPREIILSGEVAMVSTLLYAFNAGADL